MDVMRKAFLAPVGSGTPARSSTELVLEMFKVRSVCWVVMVLAF